MNLLSLIRIAMALIAGVCVFYVAWELSSGRHEPGGNPAESEEKEPGESKESNNSPGSG